MAATDVLTAFRDAITRGEHDIAERISDNPRFHESVRRLVAAFPDVQLETAWMLGDERRAAGWTTLRGTHRGEWRGITPTGRKVEFAGVLAIEVDDDDRVVDFWVVNDWLSLALQLGAELTLPNQD